MIFDPSEWEAYGAYVMVRRLPVELEKDGIKLPERQLSKNLRCEVLSVGSGEWVKNRLIKADIKPGDLVSVRQMDGRSISMDKTMRLVHLEMVENKEVDKPWQSSFLEN